MRRPGWITAACLPLGVACLPLAAACFAPSGQTTATTGGPATTMETGTQGAPTTGPTTTATTSGTGTASGSTGAGTTTTDAASSTGTVSSTDPGTSAGTTTGSTGSTGSGTTGAPDPGCGDDSGCKLHNDCCACAGVPVDEEIASCDEDCKQPRCDEYGVDQAICRFGVCTTERLSCDQATVACDAPTPDCPAGHLPEVGGLCWSGRCVPAALCDVVPDCGLCPDGTMCVQNIGRGPVGSPRCEPIPAVCGGVVDCACAGPLVCPDAFSFCALGDGVVECQCVNC